MIILISALALGAGGIAAGVFLLCVLKGNRRWLSILPFGFGLACIAGVGVLILALQHFGTAPRDGTQTNEVIEQSPESYFRKSNTTP